jgi:hypothetical protein
MRGKVVNIRDKLPFDVYVGRPAGAVKFHYGNPFGYIYGSKVAVLVGSRQESVEMFEKWLRGQAHQDLEQERRQWILSQLPNLRGKTLACWCGKGMACHAIVLAKMADEPS